MPKIMVCEIGITKATAGGEQTLFGVVDFADEVGWLWLLFVVQTQQEGAQSLRHGECAVLMVLGAYVAARNPHGVLLEIHVCPFD